MDGHRYRAASQAQLFTLTSTDENTALALNVAAAVTDTDGSETLALVASSIPVGATLSDGVNSFTATDGQTSVDISTWTLAKLTDHAGAEFHR